MDRTKAKASDNFGNEIESPGKKKLADAKVNKPDLYDRVQKNADALEAKFNKSKGYS